jgi:hypothetical protein
LKTTLITRGAGFSIGKRIGLISLTPINASGKIRLLKKRFRVSFIFQSFFGGPMNNTNAPVAINGLKTMEKPWLSLKTIRGFSLKGVISF